MLVMRNRTGTGGSYGRDAAEIARSASFGDFAIQTLPTDGKHCRPISANMLQKNPHKLQVVRGVYVCILEVPTE